MYYANIHNNRYFNVDIIISIYYCTQKKINKLFPIFDDINYNLFNEYEFDLMLLFYYNGGFSSYISFFSLLMGRALNQKINSSIIRQTK